MALNIKLFVASLVILPAVDFLWLKPMLGFYLVQLGDLARKQNGEFQLLVPPALLVYLVLALGLVVFVLPSSQTLVEALVRGAVFGLVVYGVYDLTNMATLQNYTWKLTVTDIAWGTVLNLVAGGALYLLRQRLT